MPTDYTRFSLDDIGTELSAIAREAQEIFTPLTAAQLNWKPDAASWSVAQCLDHLITIDRQMLDVMAKVVAPDHRKELVERIPFLAKLLGPTMVRSLGPQVGRKLKAPPTSLPSSSALPPTIVGDFIAHQADVVARLRALVAGREHVLMRSPFAPLAYSVGDASRLICAHERRHVEQAKRVVAHAGFPAADGAQR